ncbi:MAG: uncharacterized protein KVP18_005018 [Porospora cf. gigantea A]|uniref:uncharacterized protein n=1 Tax=Porospora cf. gigantea A TaxID=2853593 RepID=UPI00355A894F|nr:MAG: hypothetical protein KVP18_005018 [Porospora cf. gigantea A]
MSGLFLKRLLLWRNGDVTYRQTVSSDLLALSRMCQALISSGIVLAFMSSDPKNKFYDHVATPDAHGTLVWVESLEKARYPTMVNPPTRPNYTCTVSDHWTWYPTPSHFHWPVAILGCLAVLQGMHALIYFFRGRAYSVFANQPDAQFVGSPPTRFKLAAHFIRASGWVVKVLNVALAVLLFLCVYHLVIGSCVRAEWVIDSIYAQCALTYNAFKIVGVGLTPACNLYYNYRAFPSVPCGTGKRKSKPCRTMGFKWSASESAWKAREFKSPTICNDAAWKGLGKEAGLDNLAPFWPRTPMSLDLALSSQGALALNHEDAGSWISFLDTVAEEVGAVEESPELSSENAEQHDLPWTGWKTVDLAFAASYRLGMRSLIEDSFLSRVSSLWAFTMFMVFVLERYTISRLIQNPLPATLWQPDGRQSSAFQKIRSFYRRLKYFASQALAY